MGFLKPTPEVVTTTGNMEIIFHSFMLCWMSVVETPKNNHTLYLYSSFPEFSDCFVDTMSRTPTKHSEDSGVGGQLIFVSERRLHTLCLCTVVFSVNSRAGTVLPVRNYFLWLCYRTIGKGRGKLGLWLSGSWRGSHIWTPAGLWRLDDFLSGLMKRSYGSGRLGHRSRF